MITEAQLYDLLCRTGLPVVYRAWQEGSAPALPWMVYYDGASRNFSADGKVYVRRQKYFVELYTEEKDPDTERLVEAAFDGAGIFWNRDETYVESERMYKISYEIEG